MKAKLIILLRQLTHYPILINVLTISGLTLITFAWAFWIFHQPFLWVPVLSVIGLRLLASYFILGDYCASWSKASPKAFLIKTVVSVSAFVLYMPFFHGEIRIALLISELFIYLFGVNFLMYAYQYLVNFCQSDKQQSLVIFGAGQTGSQLVRELTRYQLKVFIDDDTTMQNRSINGVRIVSRQLFKDKFTQDKIDLLVIAIPSANAKQIQAAYHFCQPLVNTIKVLPSLTSLLINQPYSQQLKKIEIKDLLARHPADLDLSLIKRALSNKTVLITGAGGSIGSELAKQCIRFGVQHLLLLDHSEFNLYQIQQDLNASNTSPILLSVINKSALRQIFKQHKIDLVIHAAAYKHVPMVEVNIEQGVLNNVIGTKNVLDVAIENEVQKVILISTDKAVRPTNIMGATKRVCELYAQNVISNSTQIISVRFGNVLGSSGSVIPLFESQIKAGGPITITHPDITRYFMLIDEAAQLVLQASTLGKAREVFILDMGEPIKIIDLAKQMITLSGVQDVEIKTVGLRSGEKLYEELLINDSDKKTQYPSITVAKSDKTDIALLNAQIEQLIKQLDKVSMLKEIVPEFNHRTL